MKKVMYVIVLVVCIFTAAFLIIHNGSKEEKTDVEPPITASPADDLDNGRTFSRPEERGEDFSLLETSDVVRRLVKSEDKIKLRKAAKELGDRSIAGTLELSVEDKKAVENVVIGYLKQAKATNARERVEARQQIERLWHAAAPTLLANLNNREPAIAELVIKSLILMRNESIIKAIIEQGRTAEDEDSKALALFALKKMQEQRRTLIPGRECLNEEESAILYERLVAPALNRLSRDVNS